MQFSSGHLLKNSKLGLPSLPSVPLMPTLQGKISNTTGGDFQSVFSSMLNKVNGMMEKSEQLTEAAVTTGKVDLHEVMVAMAEEEIAIGITTNIAGKFISTIEKLTQMQV